MFRSVIALIGVCSATLALATDTATPAGGNSLACDMQPAGVDLMDFKCLIAANGLVQRFRFKADFVGSHDDTSGSLAVHLNGTPLACDAGSATQLTGDFGEVSLECKFQIQEKAGTSPMLGVSLKWFHARYTDADFISEQSEQAP